MLYWTLLPPLLLLISSLGLGLCSFAEDISAHVHVAANDHLIVFARNRDGAFHFTFTPYETPTVILHLSYSSVRTENVRSLSIPAKSSILEPIELVFIGGSRNSSERKLFHAKVQRNENNQTLSVIHLRITSIASLHSVGVECALGMHPSGTYVLVMGDRAGYVYDMNQSSGYVWYLWTEFIDNFYPKAISVTMDNYVFIGVNVQMIDTIIPALYVARLDQDGNIIDPLKRFLELSEVEITNIKSPMSMAVQGLLYGGGLVMVFGFPSADIVRMYVRDSGNEILGRIHESAEKGIHFGQAVILSDNNTYGVLSTGLATSPWSTGRVQVRYFLLSKRSDQRRATLLPIT